MGFGIYGVRDCVLWDLGRRVHRFCKGCIEAS